ncbi:MAG: hypothetical protein K5900_11490 [Butyrivibrio sp.]|nr:hypothetical protein [Butyrivibrio sp.]
MGKSSSTQLNVNEKNYITTRALAKLIGLTDERVRQLEDEGIFSSETKSGRKYFELAESIQSYVQHIKEKTTSNSGAVSSTAAEVAQAELRFKKARASKMELELSELQGQMHRAEDVEEVTASLVANMRSEMLSIPGRVAFDCEMKSAQEVSTIVKKAVDDSLNTMAKYGYDPIEYKKLLTEREKWLSLQEAKDQEKTKKQTRKPSGSSKKSAKISKPQKT